jgi:hypothetical protein
MPRGFTQPLYILPFDHRGSFVSGMFGWVKPLGMFARLLVTVR